MILRVNAMWDQSRIILGILLCIYVPQMIITILWDAIFANPGTSLSGAVFALFTNPNASSVKPLHFSPVTLGQLLNVKFCNYESPNAPSATYRAIPRFVLGVALLVLAVIPSLRQSFEMYKVTKRWRTNRTMQLLLREGAVYFVVCVPLRPFYHSHLPLFASLHFFFNSHIEKS